MNVFSRRRLWEPLGSGSCFSTAEDMLRFAEDFLTRKTFPKAYYDLLMTPGFEKDGTRRSFSWDMSEKGRPKGLSEQTMTDFKEKKLMFAFARAAVFDTMSA